MMLCWAHLLMYLIAVWCKASEATREVGTYYVTFTGKGDEWRYRSRIAVGSECDRPGDSCFIGVHDQSLCVMVAPCSCYPIASLGPDAQCHFDDVVVGAPKISKVSRPNQLSHLGPFRHAHSAEVGNGKWHNLGSTCPTANDGGYAGYWFNVNGNETSASACLVGLPGTFDYSSTVYDAIIAGDRTLQVHYGGQTARCDSSGRASDTYIREARLLVTKGGWPTQDPPLQRRIGPPEPSQGELMRLFRRARQVKYTGVVKSSCPYQWFGDSINCKICATTCLDCKYAGNCEQYKAYESEDCCQKSCGSATCDVDVDVICSEVIENVDVKCGTCLNKCKACYRTGDCSDYDSVDCCASLCDLNNATRPCIARQRATSTTTTPTTTTTVATPSTHRTMPTEPTTVMSTTVSTTAATVVTQTISSATSSTTEEDRSSTTGSPPDICRITNYPVIDDDLHNGAFKKIQRKRRSATTRESNDADDALVLRKIAFELVPALKTACPSARPALVGPD